MSEKLIIPVAEIFGPTIQGEGIHAGRVAAFVRTGGCGYRCSWCDSLHAVDPANAKSWERMPAAKIIEDVQARVAPGALVVFTGGDPCIHDGLRYVINVLSSMGYQTQIETQGAVLAKMLADADSVCFSPKPPSSHQDTDWLKLGACIDLATTERAGYGNTFLKVPVASLEDLEFADEVHRTFPRLRFYVQPVNTVPNVLASTEDLRNGLLEQYEALIGAVASKPYRSRWHVLPQIHVLVWGNRRGV